MSQKRATIKPTLITEKIYHPSQVSECCTEYWRCKMAGMAMHLSLGFSLYIPRQHTALACMLITIFLIFKLIFPGFPGMPVHFFFPFNYSVQRCFHYTTMTAYHVVKSKRSKCLLYQQTSLTSSFRAGYQNKTGALSLCWVWAAEGEENGVFVYNS